MSETVLKVDALWKRFGGFVALSEVSIGVRSGERLGIIGPNGSGKTTLINCICGALRSDQGSIRFDGKDVTRLPTYRRTRLGIARSFQIPRPFISMTVAGNVAVALEYVARRIARSNGDEDDQIHQILSRMGLEAKAQAPAGALTQVDLRKLELARALATRPSLLILDEVMAGLSASEVDEMLAIVLQLNADGVTVIMIEHIMRAIMRFSQRVLCFDAGRVIAEGTPAQVIDDPNVQRVYLGG
jgi:branched-chain amino acid transport system ATP-binding protein